MSIAESMPNLRGEIDAFDLELVTEFRDEFTHAYESITAALFELEQRPNSREHINQLFRTAHSIKSNLRMLSLNDLSEFVHAIENVMDLLRNGSLTFTHHIGDMFLLSLNRVRQEFETIAAGGPGKPSEIANLRDCINTINGESEILEKIAHVMALLDPGFVQASVAGPSPKEDDLVFLASLVHFVEGRALSPQGRTERILAMATDMNAAANRPIDPQQLAAAVYLHDVGMAFLPAELLKKQGGLSDQDRATLNGHAALGAQLLGQLGVWACASEIVAQHHERYDGTGYPNRLSNDQVCPGAKILAIADTFEAMTHARADGREKRPMLRVIAEVNAHSGGQFDPAWVDIFNRVVRSRYVKMS